MRVFPVWSMVLTATCFASTSCGHKSRKDEAQGINSPVGPAADSPRANSSDNPANAVIVSPQDATLSKNGAFLVHVEWLSGPSATAYSSAKLTFADQKGYRPQSVSAVVFSPWMPSMGHGTSLRSQTITAEPGVVGVFDVQQVDFIMGGEWQLQITATVNGSTDTADVAAKVP